MKTLIVILLLSSFAQAYDFNPYVGLNLGGAQLQGVQKEDSKSGYLMGFKGLGSWSFDTVVLDVGLGYYSQEVSNSNIYIKTKTATIDLDLRYKLNESTQLGLGSRSDLGTDNTGTEYIGNNSQSNSLFAKVVLQDKFKSYPFRYEFGAGSTVGQSRSLTTIFAGIQISLPDGNKTQSAPRRLVEESKDVAPSAKAEPNLKIDLKVAKILFDTNKFSMDQKSEQKLVRLGQFLDKIQLCGVELKFQDTLTIKVKLKKT